MPIDRLFGVAITDMKNLLPEVFRKRLIIEGFYKNEMNPRVIKSLFHKLSSALSMTPITEPLIFSPTGKGKGLHHGLAGYMAWVESGVSIYTWEDKHFFTIDIYTCKDFDNDVAVEIVRTHLKTDKLVYEEFRYE